MPPGTDDARVVIGIDTVLRNLDKSIRGVDEFRAKLEGLSKIKTPSFAGVNTTSINKAAEASAKAAAQAQELANRQERARQAADRLAISAKNLELAQRRQAEAAERAANASGKQADSHVKAFQASQSAAKKAQKEADEVAKINEQTKRQAEQQARIREQAAKSISRVETQEAKRGADTFANSLGQTAKSSEAARVSMERFTDGLRTLSSGLLLVGGVLSAALTAPLVALGVSGVRAAASLDSIKRGLRAVAGSAAEADAQLARLTEIAKLPGIGFQEAIQGSVRLQTVGFSAREAERALRAFSQAVALTGGGRVELDRITVQLGQLAAKGKVLSQDLRPIIEAAPAVGRALREAFGTVNAEDIQKLGLSSEEFLDRLITQIEQLPAVTGGARNSLENFTDALFRASAAIGDAILPALTSLIAISEPIIVGLGNAFRGLPGFIQGTVVAFGALLAVIGPLTLAAGLLTRTIADLTPLMIALNTRAIAPLIARVTALGGAFAALRAAATGAAGALALVSVWGAVAIAAGVLAVAIYSLVTAEKKFATVTEDQVKASQDRLNQLKEEVRFLKDVDGEITRTVDQQQKLLNIYESLDVQTRARVKALDDESTEVKRLTEELEKLAKVESDRLKLQGATIAAQFAQDLRKLTEQQKERLEVEKQLEEIEKARAKRRDAGEGGFPIGEQEVLDDLLKRHGELNTKIGEQEDKVRAGAAALNVYEKVTGKTSQSAIEFARQLGQIEGKTDDVTEGIKNFTEEQKAATQTINATNDALQEQARRFEELGRAADEAQKFRRTIISKTVDFLRENTRSVEDALKGLKNLRELDPALDEALKNEERAREIEKKINEALFPDASKSDSIKDDLKRLSDARLDTQEASNEKLAENQRIANEKRLQDNEDLFRLDLQAYREYLNLRVLLTNANIQLEIDAQKRLLDRVKKDRDKFVKQLGGKLPAGERIEVQTEVKQADTKIIEIETDINRLLAEQRSNRREIAQALAVQAKQEEVDLRRLSIEYAELTGRIQGALDAATDDRFAETLKKLGKEQDDLRKRIQLSKETKDADALAEEESALQRKQNIIDAIEAIREQEIAINALRVAQEFVNKAQEKQSNLEEDIAFQVDFRGQKEDEALRRRLQGEEQLKQRLLISRDIVQDTINLLLQKGIQPPQALIDFIEGMNRAVQGLGELSFNEKFDIAQRKFDDLNDARIRKIREVEDAVRLRTLAEVEGLIAIRRINGEYFDDLEKQAEVLRQIAVASGNRELIRQAKQAADTARETGEVVGSIGKQIEAAGKDAFRSGLADFFTDILNRTKSAKEAALDLLDSIVRRVNEVIAENLAQSLFESIFGGESAEGLLAKIGSFFGVSKGKDVVGQAAGAVQETAAASALTTGATAAAAQLATGATVASTTLGTGATAAAASLAGGVASVVTALAGSATTFSTAVVAAGASFAATVASAAAAMAAALGASQAAGGAASGFAGGFASGGLVPLQVSAGEGYIPPANVASMGVDFWNRMNERRLSLNRVAALIKGAGTPTSDSISALAPEGSYILRADAMRHYSSVFLSRLTRRRQHMAEGGLVRNLSEGGLRSSRLDLKQTLIDARSRLADELVSSEGRQVLRDVIAEERAEIRRLLLIDN